MSSLALNAETAGYRAAAQLDAMMSGRASKPERIVVEALGVVTRRSSEIIAVEDEDIANALKFIYREQGRGISVDDVVNTQRFHGVISKPDFAKRSGGLSWKKSTWCDSNAPSGCSWKRPIRYLKWPSWPASARPGTSSSSFKSASARRRANIASNWPVDSVILSCAKSQSGFAGRDGTWLRRANLLHGIARYSRLHGPWSFHITPGDFKQAVPEMKQWGGTGIIARIPNDRVAQAVISANVPTIALGLTDEQMLPGSPLAKFSEISSDAIEVSRVAADHLLARRFPTTPMSGSDDRGWSLRREVAFQKYMAKHGFDVHVYSQPKRLRDRVWEREQEFLARWIEQAADADRPVCLRRRPGPRSARGLQLAGLHVPEDVAVIGVDNDEVFCELAFPPLTSIALNAEAAGYRAAALLDGMMHGRSRKPRRIVVEALGVVTRRSTEVVAVEDEDVVAALQFIHREQGRGISVDDVVRTRGRLAAEPRNPVPRNDGPHDPGGDATRAAGACQAAAGRNRVPSVQSGRIGRIRICRLFHPVLPKAARQDAAQIPHRLVALRPALFSISRRDRMRPTGGPQRYGLHCRWQKTARVSALKSRGRRKSGIFLRKQVS